MVWPLPLIRWLPDTLIESGAAAKPGEGTSANTRAARNITTRARLARILDPIPRHTGHRCAEQPARRERCRSVERNQQQDGRKPEVPQQNSERSGGDRLEQVQAAELATAAGCLHPSDDRGNGERRKGLSSEQ